VLRSPSASRCSSRDLRGGRTIDVMIGATLIRAQRDPVGAAGACRSAALTRLINPTMAACAQLRYQTRQPESE
jgi:hypothetical protein